MGPRHTRRPRHGTPRTKSERIMLATSALTLAVVVTTGMAGCLANQSPRHTTSVVDATTPSTGAPTTTGATGGSPAAPPPSVYAAAGANALSPVARTAREMVYVPNTLSNTVQLIDPHTYKVVGRFHTAREPQHVVPSWDMKTLWVNADLGNSLTPVDPVTGKAG